MKSTLNLEYRLFAVSAMVLGGAVWLSAQHYSHARVVRLSFAEGAVTVQRPDVQEWAKAPVNTPIQEGFKVSTAEDSYAEVEFENASTARLGQLSTIEFTQLALAPSGSKINRLKLSEGYATFHFIPEPDDIYEVKIGETVLTPYGKTEFRTDQDAERLRVEVFSGSVTVAGPAGTETLTKNAVLNLPLGAGHYETAQGIGKDAWDQWVAKRDQQEQAGRPAASGPYSAQVQSGFYGWSDLSGYGNWGFVPGYGYGWFPDVSLGWAPYSLGRWCSYPGLGYTWISYEPWGWLPYHYGDWLFDSTFGWFWMPGGFDLWSPALVSWYEGPGWIGWAPRSTTPAGGGTPGRGTTGGRTTGQPSCSPGRTCMTSVPRQLFQNGGTITPVHNTAVALSAAQGRRVDTPDVQPNTRLLLPGTPLPQAAALMSRHPSGFGTTALSSSRSGGPQSLLGKAPRSTRASEPLEVRSAIVASSPVIGRSSSQSWGGRSGAWNSRSGRSGNSGRAGGFSRSGGFSESRGGFSSSSAGLSGGGASHAGGGGHR